jgi:uncharacterized cysteine cluster protein YcgN (CxxCxxCC family)
MICSSSVELCEGCGGLLEQEEVKKDDIYWNNLDCEYTFEIRYNTKPG